MAEKNEEFKADDCPESHFDQACDVEKPGPSSTSTGEGDDVDIANFPMLKSPSDSEPFDADKAVEIVAEKNEEFKADDCPSLKFHFDQACDVEKPGPSSTIAGERDSMNIAIFPMLKSPSDSEPFDADKAVEIVADKNEEFKAYDCPSLNFHFDQPCDVEKPGPSSAYTSEMDDIFVYPMVKSSYDSEPFDADKAVERDRIRVAKFFSSEPVEYLSTSQYCRQQALRDKQFVLIDLSGTLHIDDVATPKAMYALNLLRIAKFKVLFLTNTTKESRRILHERMLKMGFVVHKDEIFTSLNSSRAYIEKQKLRPMLMIAEEAMEDFEGVNVEDPNCVLVGLSSKDFHHQRLNQAFRLLLKPETQLLAVHKGRCYRAKDGMSLGPGPFVVALEHSTEKTAKIMGKPEREFFQSALDFIGCEDVTEAVMIGDDLRDDVLGAMILGMTGILVKTGKYSDFDEAKILPHAPDFKVANFCEAVELIIEAVADGMQLKPKLSSTILAHSIGTKRHFMELAKE